MDKILKGMQNTAAPTAECEDEGLSHSVFIDMGLKVDTKCSAGEGSVVAELIRTIIHFQAG